MNTFQLRFLNPDFTREFGPSTAIVYATLMHKWKLEMPDPFPCTNEEIAKGSGVGYKAVKDAMHKLEAYGFIVVKYRGMCNIKHIVLPHPDKCMKQYTATFNNLGNDQ